MASTLGTRTSVLAVDLSAAGAPVEWQRDRDPQTEAFIMARLAGLSALLDRAGTDLITLDSSFRLGGRRRSDALDGALAASRLGRHTETVRFAAAVAPGAVDPAEIASAITSVHKATASRGGWQVESCASAPASAQAVDEIATKLARAPRSSATGSAAPVVIVAVNSDVDVEIAAARADIARLQVSTVEEARNLRGAIRSAAGDWGRDADEIRVLVDIHTVLSDDAAGAAARAEFLTELAGPLPAGLLRHVGSVNELASLWQNWVRAGAADGFTIIPASVPTDVIAIAGQLVPELERRGLRAAQPARLAELVSEPAEAGRVLRERIAA